MLPALRAARYRLTFLESPSQITGHKATDFLNENVLVIIRLQQVRSVGGATGDREAFDYHLSLLTDASGLQKQRADFGDVLEGSGQFGLLFRGEGECPDMCQMRDLVEIAGVAGLSEEGECLA